MSAVDLAGLVEGEFNPLPAAMRDLLEFDGSRGDTADASSLAVAISIP